MSLDYKKIRYYVLAVILSAIGSCYAQPRIHGNAQVITSIAMLISMLAYTVIFANALLSDVERIPKGSWRVATFDYKRTRQRLTFHNCLFYIYLITLTMAFMVLVNPCVWFEAIYVFFAILGILLSFRIPSILIKIQREKIDNEIKARRQAAGIRVT